jgi:hypothetical protein
VEHRHAALEGSLDSRRARDGEDDVPEGLLGAARVPVVVGMVLRRSVGRQREPEHDDRRSGQPRRRAETAEDAAHTIPPGAGGAGRPPPPPRARVTAVATSQEEIGYSGGGARAGAYRLDPQVALVVDVTFATDAPGIEKKELGDHKIGGGPVLTRGSAVHPLVFERLVEVADAAGIPYSIIASPRHTSTDADAIYLSRAGVATGLVSVPNRYMHSPNEIVSLRDLDHAAALIAAFVEQLEGDADFVAR